MGLIWKESSEIIYKDRKLPTRTINFYYKIENIENIPDTSPLSKLIYQNYKKILFDITYARLKNGNFFFLKKKKI
jgi:hypothetical protein